MMRDQENAAIIDTILSGLRWATLLRMVAQAISWIATIVVVRFISTSDYGLNAMLETPLEFLFLLSTFGLERALVHTKTLGRDAVRSAFGWLLLVNGLLFLAYFFGSPLIADYFKEPRLEPLAQVLAFVFLLFPFRVIPDALLDRELKFKRKAFAELAAGIASAMTTLLLAVYGAGVWALIIGVLTHRVLLAVILMVMQPWFVVPSLRFHPVRGMIAFGGTMALASAVSITANLLPVLIAGPRLGPQAMGLFVVSMQFALLPLAKISAIINPIIFPAFAKFQGQHAAVAHYLEKAIGIAALALLPIMIGLACVGEAFVLTLFGESWAPAIVPLTLLSLSVPFRGLTILIWQVLGGIGYPGLVLRSALVGWVLLFTLILIGANGGVIGLVLAVLIAEPIVTIVTIRLGKQAINTSFHRIARGLRPAVLGVVGMAVGVLGVKLLVAAEPAPVRLVVEVGAGLMIYLTILRVFFAEQWMSTLALLKR